MPEERPVTPASEETNVSMYAVLSRHFRFLEARNQAGSLVIVSFDMPSFIHEFFMGMVGIPFTLTAWPEFERVFLVRWHEIKPHLVAKKVPVTFRLIGPIDPWIAMKMYKIIYPHVESVQYVDVVVLEI
jgi:hypothetical protein